MSQLIHSLSGTRGVIGDTMHPNVGLEMGMAFGAYLGKGPVIVGGDTRVSHDMLKSAVISGLTAVGTDVIDIGIVTTPTVQQMIRHHHASGGMVITASHNPIMWNGIKLMNKEGSFLSQDEYDDYQQLYESGKAGLVDWRHLGTIKKDSDALVRHVDLIIDKLDVSSIQQSKLRVLIDANNGAGAVANPILLDRLGIEYEIMNGEPNGLFDHDPEPLKQNLSGIITKLSQGGFDIGFVQDADADRLVILDESGHFIGEDYSLAYCIDYILSQEKQLNPKVVVNLSTSQVIDYVSKKYGASVHHTKIGESNVTQGIRQLNAVVGGEGNGGVIYPKVGWGRDSLVGIVIALKHLAESKRSVSETVSHYPRYVMHRDKFQVSSREEVLPFLVKIEKKFQSQLLNKDDGVKVIFDDAWIHVRPSNTEPIVRIFIEASSEQQMTELLADINAI